MTDHNRLSRRSRISNRDQGGLEKSNTIAARVIIESGGQLGRPGPECPGGTGVQLVPCADASKCCLHDQTVPVTRRYQPEPAALDELVDVLYRLLVDVPASAPPTPPESTCFSNAPE